MKKITMCIVGITGAMMALSLAACTPTPVKQQETAPQVEMSTGGASDKVPDPNVEPMEIISVYTINEGRTGLNQAMDALDTLDAQALVDKLVEYHILDEGCKAIRFDMDRGTGTLDLSAVPADDGELVMTAIGNTFIENFELTQLKLLVNGENFSSGDIKQGDKDYLEFNKNYKQMK